MDKNKDTSKIKFSKEESIIIGKIVTNYSQGNFTEIAKLYNEILERFDFFSKNKNNYFDVVIESLFRIKEFDKAIIFCEELLKKGYESYGIWQYTILSCIGEENIILAKKMMKKSQLLNSETVMYYCEEGGANYNNILNLSHELFLVCGPCMLLINYINDVYQTILYTKNINKEVLAVNFYELINLMYEIGNSDEIVELFKTYFSILFN